MLSAGFAVITFACNFNLTRNKLTHIQIIRYECGCVCVCCGGVVVSSGRFIYISLQGRVSLDVSSCGLFSVRSWPVKCVWVTSFHTISVVVASLFFIASRHVMISTCGPPFGPHWCVAGVVWWP